MLAYPAETKRIQNIASNGGTEKAFFHQPKLNGERGRIEWFNHLPILLSSYGNEFSFLDHIQEEIVLLAAATQEFQRLDGEIYCHGWPRERIDSALRRKKNNTNKDTPFLEFHIFDIQDENELQYNRLRKLGEIAQVIETLELKFLKIVDYGICQEGNWLAHAEDYLDNGYEGIILRDVFGQYVMKRTPALLKFKPTEQDEYTIVDVNEAISKEGLNKGMIGSFLVTSPDEPESVIFNVGAGKLNHATRIRLWNIKEELKGKTLVVKHELLKTSGQVPIAAVAVVVKGV
jgi:ATP-dependent DNA ligase